jgi:Xaa-Pro aminopeptidase
VSRIARLAERLDAPLLVTYEPNLRYLTGFSSSNAALLVEPGGAATLYADFRYASRGREVEGVTFVEVSRNLVSSLAEELAGRTIAFEAAHLQYAKVETLETAGVGVRPATGLVEALRAVKDQAEIDAIRRAAALSDEVFELLVNERFTGRSERELAWWVERTFRDRGAEGVSFGTVVAAGATASSPHAIPGDTPIEPGVLVVVDAGCVVSGYCSDCTRTFAVGDVSDRLRELYSFCLDAQLAGLAAVGPGVTGVDADAASRRPIETEGLGAAYGHGMGHGVGIEVHEAPVLRPESTDTLEPGNVVSVEPGIYLPDEDCGVRIEDLVLVTEDGRERLTQFTKELVTVA